MNKNQITKFVHQYKDGIINESSSSDLIINEDIDQCFLTPSQLTLAESGILSVNGSHIKTSSFEEIDENIEKELNCKNKYNVFNDLRGNISLFSQLFAFTHYGTSFEKVSESLRNHQQVDKYGIFENYSLSTVIKHVNSHFKKYNTHKSYQPSTTFLDEGMIKVPPKTLSFLKEIIDMLIYQVSINNVSEQSSHELMIKFLKELDIDVELAKKHSKEFMVSSIVYNNDTGFNGSIDTIIDDIPYETPQKSIPLTVRFDQGNEYEGLTNQLNEVQMITINVTYLHNLFMKHNVVDNPILFSDRNFLNRVDSVRDTIISTIIHELMHVMQFAIFSQNEISRGVDEPKSTEKGGKDYDSYVTAQVEFDPTINDHIFQFNRLVKGIEDFLGKSLDVEVKKDLLKKFLGSEFENAAPPFFDGTEEAVRNVVKQVFETPHFIKLIKNKFPKKYPVLVKKFYSEIF